MLTLLTTLVFPAFLLLLLRLINCLFHFGFLDTVFSSCLMNCFRFLWMIVFSCVHDKHQKLDEASADIRKKVLFCFLKRISTNPTCEMRYITTVLLHCFRKFLSWSSSNSKKLICLRKIISLLYTFIFLI